MRPNPSPSSDPGRNTPATCQGCAVRDMTVCAVLEPEEVRRLDALKTSLSVASQKTLFDEGDPADHVFNVTAGTVKLYKLLPDGRRAVTGFLGTGDFLGLSMSDSYAYSAETVTPATLCRFPRARMDALLDEFPKMQRRLFSMASNELVAAQDQMLLLGRKTAREKICSFLILLSERAVRRGQSGNPLHLPMSRGDIADYLGLTTETVSRTITQLKTGQAIRLLPGNKIALDLDRLYDLAEGG